MPIPACPTGMLAGPTCTAERCCPPAGPQPLALVEGRQPDCVTHTAQWCSISMSRASLGWFLVCPTPALGVQPRRLQVRQPPLQRPCRSTYSGGPVSASATSSDASLPAPSQLIR